jgi:hypothetical protein
VVTIMRRFLTGCFVLALIVALWALHVELTFERNVRRGLPADFRLHQRHSIPIWRA